jgi:hypothetical protein
MTMIILGRIVLSGSSKSGRGLRKANLCAAFFSQSLLVDGKASLVTTDRKAVVTFPDMFKHNFVGNQIFCPEQHLIDVGLFDEKMPACQDMDLFMRVLMAQLGCLMSPPTFAMYRTSFFPAIAVDIHFENRGVVNEAINRREGHGKILPHSPNG